jgi:ribosomal protein L10
MANLPSKEEAVSKLLFLLNYPVQSFVRVLDAIREKKEQN